MADQVRKQFISPRVPYYYYNPNFGKPFNAIISGFIPQDAEEFVSINLIIHSNKDFPLLSMPFHLSIRPKDQELVRNSYAAVKGWGTEERNILNEGFPLHFGSRFDMILSVTTDEITTTINGKLVFKFAHRLDAKAINMFQIQGSIFLESLCFDFL